MLISLVLTIINDDVGIPMMSDLIVNLIKLIVITTTPFVCFYISHNFWCILQT